MIERFDLDDRCECGRLRFRTREQVLEAVRRRPRWLPKDVLRIDDVTDEEFEVFWRAITEEC
jgi:hypothetical protein